MSRGIVLAWSLAIAGDEAGIQRPATGVMLQFEPRWS